MRKFEGLTHVFLSLILLFLTCGNVWADEIFVRNKHLDKTTQIGDILYTPMENYLQMLHIYWQVKEDGKVVFSKAPLETEEHLLKSAVFEAEFGSTAFAVRGVEYEGEVWVPVYWLAQCLSFSVQKNPQTGIIDIVLPRAITYEDNLAAQQLREEKEARVREAEKILAKRRADKLAAQQKRLAELHKAKAEKKKGHTDSSSDGKVTRKHKVTKEGAYPSEFDESPPAPKPKPKPKAKVTESRTTASKPEASASKVEEPSLQTRESAPRQISPVTPGKAVLTYAVGPVDVDSSSGKVKMQATIYNKSEADASGVVVHFSLNDTAGNVALRKDVSLGILKAGEERLVKAEDLYTADMSRPQLVRSLNVKLDWQVFTP